MDLPRLQMHHCPTQIANAFSALEQLGYKTRANYCCCPACAFEDLQAEGLDDNLVFYTGVDAEELEEKGECFVGWRGDPETIMGTFREHGLAPTWRGSYSERIRIRWTRRH